MAAMVPFIFGGDTGQTPQSIAAMRAVAESLAARGGTPHNLGEGLSAIGNALAYRGLMGRAQSAETAGQASVADSYSKLLGGMGGDTGGDTAPASTPSPNFATGPQPAPAVDANPAFMTSKSAGDMSNYANSISGIESGGKYDLLGPVTNGDRAYGKYQVMGANIPQWTKEALGTSMTPEQFLANPQAQDAVFNHQFGGYVQKYGNPQDAASAWFTGGPQSTGAGKSDVLGTTGRSYVDQFNKGLGGAPAASPGVSAVSGSLQAAARVVANPFATEGQRAVAQAILNRTMQQQDPAYGIDLRMKQAQLDQALHPRPEYGFTALPDGTVLRTEKTQGTASPVYGGGGAFPGNSTEAVALNHMVANGTMTRAQADDLAAGKTVVGANGPEFVPASKILGGLAPVAGGDPTAAAGPGIPLTAGGVRPNEFQSKNRALYSVAAAVLPSLDKNFDALSQTQNQIGGALGSAGNFITSTEYQQARNALRSIIPNYLYSVSGATANPGEVANLSEAVMPAFGDKPEVIAQKRAQIHQMVEAIRSSGEVNPPMAPPPGPAAVAPPAAAPAPAVMPQPQPQVTLAAPSALQPSPYVLNPAGATAGQMRADPRATAPPPAQGIRLPTAEAVQFLLAHPDTVSDFDSMYGQGNAAKFLVGR